MHTTEKIMRILIYNLNGLSFGWRSVNAHNNCMISLVRFQGNLLLRFHLLRLHLHPTTVGDGPETPRMASCPHIGETTRHCYH